MTTSSPEMGGKEKGKDQRARLVPVRILYTLNASSQFLLARQRRKVQVIPIPEDEINGQCSTNTLGKVNRRNQRYAKVSLKTCLGAVCNSSPELVADRSRDYSVYVVDPLETSPHENNAICNPESVPADPDTPVSCPWGEGVSIGMGLMSWCLAEEQVNTSGSEDDDEGYVVGKLVKDRGAEALEVVMSLRETATQTQQQHALSLSSWGRQASLTTSLPSNISSPGASRFSSPFPTSPCPLPASSLPTASQFPTVTANSRNQHLPEAGKSLAIRTPSSTPDLAPSSHVPLNKAPTAPAKKIGRPIGARTHPEKVARRLEIESLKENLERLVNISKMQRGEEYDKTLIPASASGFHKVTDEEIAQQRKRLQELESRPVVLNQASKNAKSRSCLTTQPLPMRRSFSASAVSTPTTVSSKQKGDTAAPTNAVASGSGVNVPSGNQMIPLATNPPDAATAEQRGANVLLSLLTSVLAQVDGPSADLTSGVAGALKDSKKGKEKQTTPPIDGALAGAIQQLLPFLPRDSTSQSNLPSRLPCQPENANPPRTTTTGLLSQMLSHTDSDVPHLHMAQSKAPKLFKTTDETFYANAQHGPNWPYDSHWMTNKPGMPQNGTLKAGENATQAPRGGWARGRNLMPRDIVPKRPEGGPSEDPDAAVASNASSRENAVATLGKENMPPAKTKRGLKRPLSSAGDARENVTPSKATPGKIGAKKRKQDTAHVATKAEGSERSVMGSSGSNKAQTLRTAGPLLAASSPVRTMVPPSKAQNLPVMAVSEPDFLPSRPAMPLMNKSSTPSRSTTEVPQTPPKCSVTLGDEPCDSLFTPGASISPSRPLRDVQHPSGDSLLSPTPGHCTPGDDNLDEVSQLPSTTAGNRECLDADLRSRHVTTGWDLPPSSPPPTSPVSPNNELGAEASDQKTFDFTMQLQSDFDFEMEKTGADKRFADNGASINSDDGSIAAPGVDFTDGHELFSRRLAFDSSLSASDLELSSDGFYFGELGLSEGSSTGIELDVEELWGSLGPVIAQAQTDADAGNVAPLQTEANFDSFDLGNDQYHVEGEGPGGMDPIKLAEDLKALFGGCVV